MLPGDPTYDVARRVWNADVDRKPAAIVRCASATDVAKALRWCLDNDVDVTVRGGGHNLAGTAVMDDAVMLDMGHLNQVRFHHDRELVTVGGGCRWGDVDRPAADRGVVVPAGVVSHTGVAGLTLGGGAGYLSRLLGATADYLVSAQVVLASGEIVTASADEHADLFWALKGAGHNFGIVTSFTFRHVPVPGQANVRQAFFAADDRLSVLQFFRDWAMTAPDSVTTYARLLEVPPYWSQIPTPHRGRPVLNITTVHYGDENESFRVTEPMFRAAEPVWSQSYQVPHVRLQHACDDEFRYGVGHYWKHSYLTALPDAAFQTMIDYSDRYPGRHLQAHANIAPQMQCPFEIQTGGGANSRVDPDSTSMTERKDQWGANVGTDWEFESEKAELVAWAQEFSDKLGEYQGSTYINFTSVQGDEQLARLVYGDKYERLAAVKKVYDPNNVFRRGLVDLA
ncbi:FAD-binding oxidoreductase [Streptomyces sp. NPDC056190]|uniref:FAD-binding oxidoreductase n=1 Tax=Streptomyces sp. NPDC056190 TaxID=3345741 RepID=UPI0035DEDA31